MSQESAERSERSTFEHRGARALVILHEQALRDFVSVWHEFQRSGCALPETDDPDYASTATLLRHVLGAARGYLRWVCKNLGYPEPQIAPPPENLTEATDDYLEVIVQGWREPLKPLHHKTCDRSTFDSSWGVPYCIDAMLEHAVMHPTRHAFQLRELLASR